MSKSLEMFLFMSMGLEMQL